MTWLTIMLILFGLIFILRTIYLVTVVKSQYKYQAKEIEKLEVLYNLFDLFSERYFRYSERGVILFDYAYMIDLLTARISDILDGNMEDFRKEVAKITGGNTIVTKEEARKMNDNYKKQNPITKVKKAETKPKIDKNLTYDGLMKNWNLFTQQQIDQILELLFKKIKQDKNEKK